MANDDRGPELCYVAIIFTAISLFCLCLRCYTMGFILKRFFLADWTAVLTGLNQCAFCAFTLLGVQNGLGKHVVDVAPESRIEALKWKWAGQVSYVVGSTLIKFVAGLLLLRLFAGQRWQRITIIFLMVLVALVQIFYLFIAIFQCTPIPFYWFRYTPDAPVTGRCLNPTLATIPTYVSIFLGVVSDWFLALLPITLVRKIEMERKAKISIVGILAIGSMASLANVVRIPYAKQLLSSPDYLHNFTDLAIWSIIECALGLTATSLAMLRPLFVRINMLASSRVLTTFHSRSRSKGRNGGAGPSCRARSSRLDPCDRGVSKLPTLHSTNSDSYLSHKAPHLPVDYLSPEGHTIQEVPPAFYPTRDRSHTIPLKTPPAAWQPRPPSVGTLDGQRETRDETWFLPLQPPPPPRSPHRRGFSS